MLKIVITKHEIPIPMEDIRLITENNQSKDRLFIWANTRWFKKYWDSQKTFNADTEKLFIAELEASDSVYDTLENWFSEDSVTFMSYEEIKTMTEYYELIKTGDLLELLQTEKAADGNTVAHELLFNEIDLLIKL